jgi:hypothetical protein
MATQTTFSAVAALISASDLRYAAAQGANASTSRIVTEVSMMNDAHTILEAFGLACADDNAAMVAAQVCMIAYIKEDTFNLPAAMMEAQMKISKLSATRVYGIANETLRFNLDAPVVAVISEEKKEPGKRGRARNEAAWELAEQVFIADMTRTMPEMTAAITAKFADQNIDAVCIQMIYAFEEKYGVSLVRGKRGGQGRTRNETAWNIAEQTFDDAIAQVPDLMFNTMVELIETVLAQNSIEMTGPNFVLKFEEQKNIKLVRGKRGRAARKVEEMA